MQQATPVLTDGRARGRPGLIIASLCVATLIFGFATVGFGFAVAGSAGHPVLIVAVVGVLALWGVVVAQHVTGFRLARRAPEVLWLLDDTEGPGLSVRPYGRVELRLVAGEAVRVTVTSAAAEQASPASVGPTGIVLSARDSNLVVWLREPFTASHYAELRGGLASVGVTVGPAFESCFSTAWTPEGALSDHLARAGDDGAATSGSNSAAIIRGGSWRDIAGPQLFILAVAAAAISLIARDAHLFSASVDNGEFRFQGEGVGRAFLGGLLLAGTLFVAALLRRLTWRHTIGGPWIEGRVVAGAPSLVGRTEYLAAPVHLALTPGAELRIMDVAASQIARHMGTTPAAHTRLVLALKERSVALTMPGWYTPAAHARLVAWCRAHQVTVTPADFSTLPRRVTYLPPRLDRL